MGPCTRASRDAYTHFELESLPPGEWGYLHFPVTARYARTLGLDCMGMTGKFHTEWGDFHSLKNQAALEFECFRMLSYGYDVSIGDQFEPYRVLNPDVYQLIGKVFHQLKEREAWARPSKALVEAALVNEMAQNILEAIDALEYKPIRYDQVRTAIDKAEALNQEEYKDFSRVEAAVKAVMWDKNVTEQADVDAMAKAIEDAIAALEYKRPITAEWMPPSGRRKL